MMDGLWAAIKRREGEAKATPVGRFLMKRGWTLEQTGGGCMAWAYVFGHAHSAWITCVDGGDVTHKLGEPVTLGFYEDEEDQGTTKEYPNLKAALVAFEDYKRGL
jgi:hypothetical protein